MGVRLEARFQNTLGNPPKLPSTPGSGQNGQVLRWNNGSSAWEFVTISGGVSDHTDLTSLGWDASDHTPGTPGSSVDSLAGFASGSPVTVDPAVLGAFAGSKGSAVSASTSSNTVFATAASVTLATGTYVVLASFICTTAATATGLVMKWGGTAARSSDALAERTFSGATNPNNAEATGGNAATTANTGGVSGRTGDMIGMVVVSVAGTVTIEVHSDVSGSNVAIAGGVAFLKVA